MVVKTKTIEKINLKFPGLFKPGTEDFIKHKLNTISTKKEELAQLHMRCTTLEQEIKAMEEDMKPLAGMIEVVYETAEVEDKVHGECNLLINNPEDARHLNYGSN